MIVFFILAILLLCICINDFLYFRIENEYVIALITLYIIHLSLNVQQISILQHLSFAVLAFITCVILNYFDLMGGGDAKLIFPLALFAGDNIMNFLLYVSLAGLFLAAIYAFLGEKIELATKNVTTKINNINQNSKLRKIFLLSSTQYNLEKQSITNTNTVMMKEIPYGIALSVGNFLAIIDQYCYMVK